MAKEITETVYVTVNSSEKEIAHGITHKPIIAVAKLIESYNNAIKLYEKAGYTIVSSNPEKTSFIAEKKKIVDE